MDHSDHHDNAVDARAVGDSFPTDTGGLAPAATPETVDLRDGEVLEHRIDDLLDRKKDKLVNDEGRP